MTEHQPPKEMIPMQTSRLIRTAIGAAAVSASLIGPAVSAEAAPTHAPSASVPIAVTCGGLGQTMTITNSGSSQAVTWNPFFVVDSAHRQTQIDPTELNLSFTENGSPVGAIEASKGDAPGAITCTVAGRNGSFAVTGTVIGNVH